MRFLVDAQLPPALARMLTDHGHHAEHVTDVGPADASDRELWRYALDHEPLIDSVVEMIGTGNDLVELR